ncbi:putative rhamnosyl transferase [Tritonibacter mobilis]|nr:putative rhamnosyl transferase [Tritonibacter mobilis]
MAATFKMVGVIRFSLLTPTFNADRYPDLEAAAAAIFAPDRMALRLHLFETLCLPSLVRQSDAAFHLVVATSDRLPAAILQHLQALLAPHDHMQLIQFAPENHYQILKEAYRAVPQQGESHRILFRLDDDDALDRHYVARCKRLAAGLVPLQTEAVSPIALAFNRGYYLIREEGQPPVVMDSCERAPLSAGTALVQPVAARGNPYRYNHRKFAQHYTLYSDISVPSFVRTVHGDNHSTPAMMGLTARQSDAEIDADLQRHFDLSLSDLKAI